ncbi:adenosylcobinamide-GDP ribazoletransferase [Desulfosarcina ovata subsp. sediminis]|uniref:Adenosylcobinamide-GDP ribazoletransferase n=1 Tax=Desulfosarcina ovata subsp. sediminis TaxID=885957 RepID=A0A5K7ZR34_9BACT|nr:adenosylcobinamide-GDP ribazoletransferase [Desulfosarcina ovata]BBO80493.1 adenosylcobinamide-GDP ribazoletransferase [Desulfosarcina ovata subsp. sediminis]
MNRLIASLQFISALPLGKPRPFDPKGIIVHFPVAGLVIGLIVALFDQLAGIVWPPAVAAVLDVGLLALMTGAFHLDGLADMADGLYGHGDRERSLAIMKDSRVGAMGLVAVALLLLTKTVALGNVHQGRFLALVIIPAYARGAMIVGMRFLPYARGEEGTGSAFFETPIALTDFRYLLIPVILSLFLGWRGIVLNLFFAAVVAGLLGLYRRKLGGITGDLLGAMTEISEAALLLAVCMGGGL